MILHSGDGHYHLGGEGCSGHDHNHDHHSHSHDHGHVHEHGHTHAHKHTNKESEKDKKNLGTEIGKPSTSDAKKDQSENVDTMQFTKNNDEERDGNSNDSNNSHSSHESHEHNHSHSHGGDAREDYNLLGDAALLHVLGDLLMSVGVIMAGVLIYLDENLWCFDPLCTYLFSVIVMCTTVPIVKTCVKVLMEGAPDNISTEDLRQALYDSNPKDNKDIHCLHVWSVGPK